MCWGPPWVPQLVPSLQSPWGGCSVPGLAKALAVEKELQGQKDTRTEGHLPLSPSCHLDCPFPTPPPTSVSLSPLTSAVPALRHDRTPDHPGGVQPSLVTPAAPADMADVPWEGNTLRHPVFGTFLGFRSQEHRSGASPVPWQGGRWVQAGTPSWELGTGHLGLAQPQPWRAVGGLFSAWTGR